MFRSDHGFIIGLMISIHHALTVSNVITGQNKSARGRQVKTGNHSADLGAGLGAGRHVFPRLVSPVTRPPAASYRCISRRRECRPAGAEECVHTGTFDWGMVAVLQLLAVEKVLEQASLHLIDASKHRGGQGGFPRE